MAKGTLTVRIVGDAKSFSRTMRSVSDKVSGFGTTVARFGAAAATAGAAAVTALGVKATSAASDLEQSLGAVESVFGDARDEIDRFAATAAEKFGLSRRAVNEMASVMGAQLQSFGFEAEEAAETTVLLQQRAADMAATFGGPVEDAVGAIGALMRGERDPIERFGVSIKQADVNARLAAEGLNELEGEERKLAEAQAALDLLMEQTATTAGTFARESDTLAGQQERLKAEFENVAASIGEALLPLASQGVDAIRVLVEWLGPKIREAVDVFTAKVEEVAAWWEEHGPAIKARVMEIGEAIREWWEDTAVPAIEAVRDALKEWWDGTGKDILEAAVKAWEDNKEAISDFVSASVELISELAALLGNAFSNATQGADEDVENMGNTLGTFLESVTEIVEVLADFVGWMNKISDSLFAPLRTNLEIIRVIAGAVADQFRSLRENYEFLRDAFGFGGGSKSSGKSNPVSLPSVGVPMMADGGIVTRPTLAMIGEGGESEAVIPLSRLNRMTGGTTINVNITATEVEPDRVVDAIRRYTRRNGPVGGFA